MEEVYNDLTRLLYRVSVLEKQNKKLVEILEKLRLLEKEDLEG